MSSRTTRSRNCAPQHRAYALFSQTSTQPATSPETYSVYRDCLRSEGSLDQIQTEVDLLERWWTTADGAPPGRRDRARLLADLADAVLAGRDPLDSRADVIAIEALVASASLRELGLDRLTFCHDVLREWAVAARLRDLPDRATTLTLSMPAPASLARGVELGARVALERVEDGRRWIEFLDRVSMTAAHPSWRRWSLLAVLRSEKAELLLDRAVDELLAADGTLLRELIRTALAVESEPLADMIARLGGDAPAIPRSVLAPVNSSWARLDLLRKSGELLVRKEDFHAPEAAAFHERV